MRYRTEQVRRAWNRLAKPQYKLTKFAIPGLREDCRKAEKETGARRLEMPAWATRSGQAEVLEF